MKIAALSTIIAAAADAAQVNRVDVRPTYEARRQTTMLILGGLLAVASGSRCGDTLYAIPPTTSVATVCVTAADPNDFKLPHFELHPELPPFPRMQMYFGLLGSLIPPISQYETPIQHRFVSLIDTLLWNCVAAFDFTHLASVPTTSGNSNAPAARRPAASNPDPTTHSTDARIKCGMHAVAAATPTLFPPAGAAAAEAAFLTGFSAQVLELTAADMGISAGLQTDCPNASDVACLAEYAECRGNTPRAIGEVVAYELLGASANDGWNAAGSASGSAEGCTGNGCDRPYADTTGFDPRNPPNDALCRSVSVVGEDGNGDGSDGADACWVPLTEDNGLGMFSKQQFVVRHIGATAAPRALSRAEVDARVAAPPNYNYTAEASAVLARLDGLSNSRREAVKFFDSKLSVAFAVFTAVLNKYGPGATYEKFVFFSLGYTVSELDATLVVWKEKMRWNLVRPTTVFQEHPELLAAGGKFEALVRVMPHAEYPSGSACLCQGLTDYARDALEFLFGSQDLEVVAGNLSHSSLAHLKEACGDSRLDGGLHFEASVTNAYTLCSGIGNTGFVWATELLGREQGNSSEDVQWTLQSTDPECGAPSPSPTTTDPTPSPTQDAATPSPTQVAAESTEGQTGPNTAVTVGIVIGAIILLVASVGVGVGLYVRSAETAGGADKAAWNGEQAWPL